MHKGQKVSGSVLGDGVRWLSALLVAGAFATVSLAQQQGGMGNSRSSSAQMGEPQGLGQSGSDPFRQQPQQQGPWGDNNILAMRQLSALNAERQKALISDTEKLLKLAQELKNEIGSGKSDSYTPEQLRKLASIEKLAHSVKQKMSLTLGPGPTFHDEIDPTRP
jgi:hypothetical protein